MQEIANLNNDHFWCCKNATDRQCHQREFSTALSSLESKNFRITRSYRDLIWNNNARQREGRQNKSEIEITREWEVGWAGRDPHRKLELRHGNERNLTGEKTERGGGDEKNYLIFNEISRSGKGVTREWHCREDLARERKFKKAR